LIPGKDLVGRATIHILGRWNSDVRRGRQKWKRRWAIAALTQALVVKLHRLYKTIRAGDFTGGRYRREKVAGGAVRN